MSFVLSVKWMGQKKMQYIQCWIWKGKDMRISVIMGSPRKKDSYRICKLIKGYFTDTSNAEFEYLFLKDYHIMDCKGCAQCFQGGGDKSGLVNI